MTVEQMKLVSWSSSELAFSPQRSLAMRINVWLTQRRIFIHRDLDHSKNHCIVLPEQLAKMYQHTPFFFFVMDSLGKHRYKKLFQLLEYLAERVHAYLPYLEGFILLSRKHSPH